MVADAGGTIVSELRYSAFGEIRYQNGTLTTDYLYTGQRQEAEIGLYYYVARWYDPAIGRFIQADSIVPYPENVLGYDRYAYAANNPIRFIDPTGHWWCEGYQDCVKWVEFALTTLRNGGEHSNQALASFVIADSETEIKLNFIDDQASGMYIRLYAEMDVKNKEISIGDQIKIHGSNWDPGKDPTNSKVALLGHEFTHLGQSPELALSVIGELLAYEVQYQIIFELTGNPTSDTRLVKIHDFVTNNNIHSVSFREQEEARQNIIDMNPNGGYEKLPYFPGNIILKPKPGTGGGGNPSNLFIDAL
jgi:RHS repeat-associated protein